MSNVLLHVWGHFRAAAYSHWYCSNAISKCIKIKTMQKNKNKIVPFTCSIQAACQWLWLCPLVRSPLGWFHLFSYPLLICSVAFNTHCVSFIYQVYVPMLAPRRGGSGSGFYKVSWDNDCYYGCRNKIRLTSTNAGNFNVTLCSGSHSNFIRRINWVTVDHNAVNGDAVRNRCLWNATGWKNGVE